MNELTTWLSVSPTDPTRFPYQAVVAAIQHVGKAAIPAELLALLDKARGTIASPDPSTAPPERRLHDFLDILLDRWDGRFDAPSYLALRLLPLPAGDDLGQAWRDFDWTIITLIADLMRFETTALHDGAGVPLPQLRPPASVVAKRCRLALRAATPAMTRLRINRPAPGTHPVDGAQVVWSEVAHRAAPERQLAIRLSMLPVDTYHDELLFIRVLQCFEAAFCLMVVELSAATTILRGGNARLAAIYVDGASSVLREAAPLFSLLATMQRDSFGAFRVNTEGASAIQSRSAKLVEALCSRPSIERLDSTAFTSVPELREAILAGDVIGFEDVYAAVADHFDDGQRRRIEDAMSRLAEVWMQWRQTHYRLAVRMLGDQPGTGYTSGPAYLAHVRSIPLFRTIHTLAPIEPRQGTAEHPCR